MGSEDIELSKSLSSPSWNRAPNFDHDINSVPKRHMGTPVDKQDMKIMGKKQETRVGILHEMVAVPVLMFCSEISSFLLCSDLPPHV